MVNGRELISAINQQSGELGGRYASSGTLTPSTGYVFFALQAIADSVITAVGNVSGITNLSVSAGTVIYGRFTSITVVSGGVIIYDGVS